MHSELNALLTALNKEETEHTWEIIDKALKRFHAVIRGGVHKSYPDELVKGMKDKDVVKGLVRSVSDKSSSMGRSCAFTDTPTTYSSSPNGRD